MNTIKIKQFIFFVLIIILFYGCKLISEQEKKNGNYEVSTVVVVFIANDGIPAPDQQVINSGSKASLPATMTKTGYTFDGWFREEEFINEWNFETYIVNKDLTLYAKWTQNIPILGGVIRDGVVFLTVGDRRDLSFMLPSNMTDRSITWQSSNNNLVTVNSRGIAEARGINLNADMLFTDGYGTGTVTITATVSNPAASHYIQVTSTTEALVDIMSLPPIKDQFASYFLIGNIYNPGDTALNGSSVTNERLAFHYNVLTHENDMKPTYLATARNANTGVITYNFATANRMVNAAIASGFLVNGHTLLWHSQNRAWMNNLATAGRTTTLAVMKQYITRVVTEFKGKIYSWDVLNEVFPDGVRATDNWRDVMRPANPWYAAIGSDFVYEGFLAARLADPEVILYYNDFNTEQVGKATMIRDMVRDVNQRYLTGNDKPAGEAPGRLLIEGIGMQEHHNTGVNVSNIRATLNLFKPLGVIISVSELDVLGQTWGQFSPTGSGVNKHTVSTVTNNGLLAQAVKYEEYMRLYIEFSDIIERVSLWGVTDNSSWRSGGLPLLFDHTGKAKPSYYSFIKSLD